ncbi:hypothetical protein PVNG_06379 [Plasmodium vivax North Korean]|uniref:Variable surface protein n=1 Tax=Plasmodium vivax North Korean TaxID=1035514 RepID=A0A0J9U362_PLAVI|nr:hypothetical protein PVNG_06379 [Plasmodium vivax North Korean]
MIKNKGTKNYGRFLKQCFIKIIIFYNFSSFLIKSFQRSKCILHFKHISIIFFRIIFQNDEQVTQKSSNIYSILNNDTYKISQNSDEECEQIYQMLSGEYNNFKNFCMNLNRILQNYDILSFPDTLNDDKCTIINLWTYDHIYNKMSDHTKKQEFDEIIPIVGSIWNNYLGALSGCHMYIDRISKKEFNDMKNLYDYVKNYENIALHLKDKDYICKKNLKNYIDGIQDIYLRSKAKSIPGTHMYHRILQDFVKVNTGKKLSAVTCKETIDQEPSSEDSQLLDTSPEGGSAQELKLPESVVELPSKLSGKEGEQRSVVSEVAATDASQNHEMSSYKEGAESSDKVAIDAGLIGDHSETVIPGKVGTVGATLAGSSLFLVMLYKVIKHNFNNY